MIKNLHLALAFLTRLPLPPLGTLPEGALAGATAMFPLVGLVVGGIGATVYALAHLALPAAMAAVAAVAAMTLATGCLHEDGLADVADGFGGGADRERKLEIMRDSRIGSYGVAALVLALALRLTALAALEGTAAVAGALLAAHALSRAVIPAVMRALPPARATGLGASAGRPDGTSAGIAATLAILVAALALPSGAAVAAVAAAPLGALAIGWLARRQIGGQTGDVLGAVQQAAELGVLVAVVAAR